MTANRQIFLNIVATYGRSLYALAIGLFCGRWILMALGQVDYGLMGVVGGLAYFISFLNGVMASGVSRFYAYAVGLEQIKPNGEGLVECRNWFNTAIGLHVIISILLVAAGYPLGLKLIRHYLIIPPDRLVDCIWVWRFVCVTCFVTMINVPFKGMYTAKQEIAELTIYGFLTSTLNACMLYYMVTHPGIWLARYMAWTCALNSIPEIIICIRSFFKYEECRVNIRQMFNRGRTVKLIEFVGGRFLCAVALLLNGQLPAIFVNRILGPIKNATMSVANSVSAQSMTLSSSIIGAFQPAITSAAGAGNLARMRRLMYATCTFSTFAVLLFTLPLCLEAEEVFNLWLKDPPALAAPVCVVILISFVIAKMTDGLWMGILAMGKINAYQISEAIMVFLGIPLTYYLIKSGFDVMGVAISAVVVNVLANGGKLYFAKKHCGISIRWWFAHLMLPVMFVSMVSVLAGCVSVYLLNPSLLRIIITTVVVELFFIPLALCFLLAVDDRRYLKERILSKFLHC